MCVLDPCVCPTHGRKEAYLEAGLLRDGIIHLDRHQARDDPRGEAPDEDQDGGQHEEEGVEGGVLEEVQLAVGLAPLLLREPALRVLLQRPGVVGVEARGVAALRVWYGLVVVVVGWMHTLQSQAHRHESSSDQRTGPPQTFMAMAPAPRRPPTRVAEAGSAAVV